MYEVGIISDKIFALIRDNILCYVVFINTRNMYNYLISIHLLYPWLVGEGLVPDFNFGQYTSCIGYKLASSLILVSVSLTDKFRLLFFETRTSYHKYIIMHSLDRYETKLLSALVTKLSMTYVSLNHTLKPG